MTSPLTMNQGLVCCEYSRQAGEPLFATATVVDVWLLLEQPLPWGKEAFIESTLPQPVKAHLSAALDTIPRSRLQFIRQPTRQRTQGITFFIVRSHELRSALYRFDLTAYEDILNLDLVSIATGDLHYQVHLTDESVMLICTNGRRDISCAKYGTVVYDAMSRVAPNSTWQTTHLGGHRFAATSVFLPHGLSYGRLTPDQVPTVVEAYRRGEIVLEAYRGRSFHDEPVQAADYFLRQQTGNHALDGLSVVRVSNIENHRWQIVFASLSDQIKHLVEIEQFTSEFKTYKNSTDTEPTHVPQYRLLSHAVMPD